MHHRVHVDNGDRLIVPHDGGKRQEEAILRFYLRHLFFSERFSFLDPLQIHDDFPKLASRTDVERLQNAPAFSVGNAPAIERVRERGEVVPLRLRNRPLQLHNPGQCPAIRYGDFFIG